MFEQTFKKMLENFKVILVELMLLKKSKFLINVLKVSM